jgi:branched-chain amino acid transport system substrate-binding protein
MTPYTRAFALAVLTAAALSGCSSASKEILIGNINPVTGEAATFGASSKNGATLAAEEWNAAGGLLGKKIKLIYADDKGDPAEGATVFTKAIEQDKVVAILGGITSRVALAGAPICQAAKIPLLSPTATNEKVTETGDYIFRSCFIDSFQGGVAAKFAHNELAAAKAAVIYDVGRDYSKGLAENFKASFEAAGGKVIESEAHPSGASDFKAQLTKIVQAKPDTIYIPDFYNDVALIAKQARELGFKGSFVGCDGWDSPELVKIAGDSIEGGVFTNHYAKDDTRPIVQEFVKKYQAKFGGEPDALAVLAYDGANILFDSIKRAGKTDSAAIRDALAATKLDTVTGTISYDEKRNPIKSVVILEIKGGKQVYRATVNP